jgi:hypothetical protein
MCVLHRASVPGVIRLLARRGAEWEMAEHQANHLWAAGWPVTRGMMRALRRESRNRVRSGQAV